MATPSQSTPQANGILETEFFQAHAQTALDVYVRELAGMFWCQLEYIASRSESPLEAAFAAWWESRVQVGASLGLCQQVATEACGHSYRLDFVVVPVTPGLFSSTPQEGRPKIAIELDGHDFHERTKEQVAYRNKRDRDLQAAGWQVWHVSGSEFHRSPSAVVDTEYKRAFDLYNKAFPMRPRF